MTYDPLTNMLWLLALRIAAGHEIAIDLDTWPSSYAAVAQA